MSAKNSHKKQKTTSDKSPNILQNNDDNIDKKLPSYICHRT